MDEPTSHTPRPVTGAKPRGAQEPAGDEPPATQEQTGLPPAEPGRHDEAPGDDDWLPV